MLTFTVLNPLNMFRSSQLAIAFAVIILTAQGCHTQNTKNSAFNGKWAITFNTSDIGQVRSVMIFEFEDSTFVAYTRKGADRNILGFWKSTLGRLFTNNFKHGALINITNGKVKSRADTLLLSGIFRSAMGSYYFKGTLCRGALNVNLTDSKKEIKGTLDGSRVIPAMSDYPGLIAKALAITKSNIYNKSVLNTPAWASFEKDITRVAAGMQDDIEMEFAFFYYAAKLPFSHYALLRPKPEAAGKPEAGLANQVDLVEKSPETAYMKIKTFSGTAAEMDSVFLRVIDKRYKNLIVDLRDNPGGTIEAGMKFATRVADTTFYGGVFLTQKWFEKNSAPPAVKDYDKLPDFTAANFELIIKGIHQQQGLCLKVIPQNSTYKGRLFILTNSRTASTCEPIVYGLKQNKRAVIVGERTAGVMLNGESFKVEDNFSLIVPTADYYASDGYRIDQKGVVPNRVVNQAGALQYVMEHLVKQ
jgi:hypothetical protein